MIFCSSHYVGYGDDRSFIAVLDEICDDPYLLTLQRTVFAAQKDSAKQPREHQGSVVKMYLV